MAGKIGALNPDLFIAQKLVWEPHGLFCTQVVQEAESEEYAACTFKLNNHAIIFRVAKITPTKIGQFVTIWKRSESGPIAPYDVQDPFDFCIISVRKGENVGHFIFSKEVLAQQGFVSIDGSDGKRAMRVYPPWDKPDSPQAKKTQNWQLMYFVEIQPDVNASKMLRLLS
jgi:hypothetical protein